MNNFYNFFIYHFENFKSFIIFDYTFTS